MDGQMTGEARPSDAEIKQFLERFCMYSRMEKRGMLIRIVRFAVREALAGREVSEASIGCEIYGDGYAAKSGSMVRQQMGNLRDVLAGYYQDNVSEPILMKLVPHQYTPSFSYRTVTPPETQRPNDGEAQTHGIWYKGSIGKGGVSNESVKVVTEAATSDNTQKMVEWYFLTQMLKIGLPVVVALVQAIGAIVIGWYFLSILGKIAGK